jgi:ribosomal protein L36
MMLIGKNTTSGLLAFIMMAVIALGCQNQKTDNNVAIMKVSTDTTACCATADPIAAQNATGTVKTSTKVVCTSCGQIKGTDVCCHANMPICGCGLQKGAPGCCKITKGSDEVIVICMSCEQFKGTENCCKMN